MYTADGMQEVFNTSSPTQLGEVAPLMECPCYQRVSLANGAQEGWACTGSLGLARQKDMYSNSQEEGRLGFTIPSTTVLGCQCPSSCILSSLEVGCGGHCDQKEVGWRGGEAMRAGSSKG